MGYLIERANDRDLATIAVYAEAIIGETGMDAFAAYDEVSIYTTLQDMKKDDTSAIFVVKKDDELVGVLGGTLARSYWNGDVCLAHHMFWWVHPENRQDGLGVRLVREFEGWARNSGAAGVSFSTPVDSVAQHALREYRPIEIRMFRRLDHG